MDYGLCSLNIREIKNDFEYKTNFRYIKLLLILLVICSMNWF